MSLSKRKLKLRSKRNRYNITVVRLTVSITDLSGVMSMPESIEDSILFKAGHLLDGAKLPMACCGRCGFDLTPAVMQRIEESMATPDVVIPSECTTPEQVDIWLMTGKLMSFEECRSVIENFNVEDMYPKHPLEEDK